MQHICSADETRRLILTGRPLLLAGDEALLEAMPKGNWIGGTIPYFMTQDGGLKTTDRLFVTELRSAIRTVVKAYDATDLNQVANDHFGHGFTVLLLPGFSNIHTEFAKNVADYESIFIRPLVGWVAGVAIDDIGRIAPKVFNGETGEVSETRAFALHVHLPENSEATVHIVNLFTQGDGPEIAFDETGFAAREASIGGTRQNLAAYLADHHIDTKLPLVADYHGAQVNVCIRNVNVLTGETQFYAPVFPGVHYRIAKPIHDYATTFTSQFSSEGEPFTFSYNCILNYVYANLEGKTTGRLLGPMTFGEIAYVLLNQTAVYLDIQQAT